MKSIKNIIYVGFAVFACFALSPGTANAQIPPPVCPGPDCSKVVTIYNNTAGPIFAVIQAGIQNPDPWLQALFNNNNQSYAETHYSRAYVNPENGIPPRTHVSVTVPWYSQLQGDEDTYVDWYNGCRIYFFDTKAALDKAHEIDKDSRLSFTDGSPRVSCADCEKPLFIYKDKGEPKLFDDDKVQFQLVEYTFVSVNTDAKPFIINLNVGYNVSYLDQIYLPLALAPCGTEPCNGPDPTAVGYLGTIQNLGPQEDKSSFRDALNKFANDFDWPQYDSPLENQERRPHLPGTYNVLVDAVNVAKGKKSRFTTPPGTTPPGRAIRALIEQWQTCTSDNANAVNCPQFEKYKELDAFFRGNYHNYRTMGNLSDCPKLNDPRYYPVPAPPPTDLNILPYVYGWVPFNSGCNAGFNALKLSPGPESRYLQVQFNYINYLQYNYEEKNLTQQQWFNPFVRLVHGKDINASSYAFSVDDAAGYQQHPGEGLIIAIGGPEGLPNKTPVVPPANYKKDFLVSLSDSVAQNRPRWKSFSVCGGRQQDFPELPKNAKRDAPDIIVDTIDNQISPANPCTITVTDAAVPKNRTYQFTVSLPVPWPPWNQPQGPDPRVVTSVKAPNNRFWNINEVSTQEPRFALITDPPLPR